MQPCACGCGQLIGPQDNHPFYSTASCQQLWMASQAVPEGDRASWRSQQRFFYELWFTVPWKVAAAFSEPVDESLIIQVANSLLHDHTSTLRPFANDELEDALRLLVQRWNMARSGHPYRLEDLLPGWVTSRRGIARVPAVDRVRRSSAATLDTVSQG